MYNNKHLSPLRLQNPLSASLDKVTIWATNFDVSPLSNLQIQPRPFTLSEGQPEYENPLFTMSDGNEVYGSKAYFNSDRLNVTIERKNGDQWLGVSFNPNKFSHYYEATTDKAQRRAQISSVRNDLEEIGLSFDYEGSRLSRVDLMKQQQLPDPLSLHHPVLSSLSAKRQTSRVHHDTFRFGNKSHQSEVYDKSLEAKIPNLPNLTRFEIRALNGRSVNRLFGLSTISDLMEADTEELTSRYNEHLKSSIFHAHTLPDETLASEIKLMEFYISQSQRGGVSNYLQNRGAIEVFKRFGSVDAIASALVEVGLSRQKAHQWKTKLSRLHSEAIAYQKRAQSETARLYDNLYSFAV
jgi:hypothetical protein